MIAMIHNVCWLQRANPLKYLKGREAAFENSELDHNAEFTAEAIEYLLT